MARNVLHFVRTAMAVVGLAILLISPLTGDSPAYAQADAIKWRGVAVHRIGAQWEKWLWLQEELPKRTNGRLTLEVFTLQEMGLSGTEMLRILKGGLVDIAEFSAGYVAGDFPLIEATDLPGLAKSSEEQKQLVDVWRKEIIAPQEDIMGGKLLATFFFNSSFLYTNYPVTSLADIKGHKVRVFSPSQAKYISALGGEPLNMPMQEVYSALQRGVVDSLITGPDQVKGISMWEVAPNMTAIGVAGSVGYVVVSGRTWQKLPPDIRKMLEALGPELNELGWRLGFKNDKIGIDLATEKGMKITIPAKDEWAPTFAKISREIIIPDWLGRAGPQGREAFNKHLAPIVGFTIQ